MAKRKIIRIDQEKCNGCGACIPNCPEGAIQIIDGKPRLISDLFCDGLGACIGHCPQGAITIEEREAREYDERRVMENIVKQGKNVIRAHLDHLKEHNQHKYLKQATDYLKEKGIKDPLEEAAIIGQQQPLPCGCPGTKLADFRKEGPVEPSGKSVKGRSQLGQWPIQIKLVPPLAPYLQDADLLVAADCTAFAYADFHEDLLKGKVLLVGCPKLDDIEFYQQRLTQVLQQNKIKSITCAHMEVPCCFGLINIIKSAIASAGKDIAFKEAVISIKGKRLK